MFGNKQLKKQVHDLKMTVNSLKTSLDNMRDGHSQELQLLRRQVVQVVSGQALDPEAILTGSPYTEIPAEKAADFISSTPEVAILDVRTDGEWRLGHIPNAIHIDIQGFESHVDKLPQDKSRPIICFCAHGVRSDAACQILAQLGYACLFNVDGGMSRYTGEVVVQ